MRWEKCRYSATFIRQLSLLNIFLHFGKDNIFLQFFEQAVHIFNVLQTLHILQPLLPTVKSVLMERKCIPLPYHSMLWLMLPHFTYYTGCWCNFSKYCPIMIFFFWPPLNTALIPHQTFQWSRSFSTLFFVNIAISIKTKTFSS